MLEFENTIVIGRARSAVFAYVSELTNIPAWNYSVRSVTQTSGTGAGVGATYHQVRREDEQQLIIRTLLRDQELTVETLPGSKPAFTRSLFFHAVSGGTELHDRWALDAAVPRLFARRTMQAVKEAVAENLSILATLLEQGAATLQDGRVSRLYPVHAALQA